MPYAFSISQLEHHHSIRKFRTCDLVSYPGISMITIDEDSPITVIKEICILISVRRGK